MKRLVEPGLEHQNLAMHLLPDWTGLTGELVFASYCEGGAKKLLAKTTSWLPEITSSIGCLCHATGRGAANAYVSSACAGRTGE